MRKIFTQLKNFKTTIILTGLLLAGKLSYAQVKSTDLNPDVTITQTELGNDEYPIDLDGDGTDDFTVAIEKVENEPIEDDGTFTGLSIGITPLVTGNLIALSSTDFFTAQSFNTGNTINNTLTFVGSKDGAILFSEGVYTVGGINTPITLGDFDHSTGTFVGVKFLIDGNTHYGYIGINTTGNSFTITSFGYEQTADAAVLAGGQVAGVSNYLNSITTIKNINNTIIADFSNPFTGKIEVVNMNGQVVKTIEVSGNSAVLNMEEATTGIYQVVISGAEGIATKKILIASR